jgi:hypothetical protein
MQKSSLHDATPAYGPGDHVATDPLNKTDDGFALAIG